MSNTNNEISLSVVIPAYNVEDSVLSVISNISKILNSNGLSYEIIVVNDGSTDNTWQVLQNVKKENYNLIVLSYKQNKGKGYAVRKGILESKGKFVMYVDGDLDINTQIIREYLDELSNYDILIASKNHPESKIQSAQSRQILSRIFNSIVRIFTGIKIKDTQAGLKVGNGEIFRKIFGIMSIDGFAFDVEFLTIACILNAKIMEMPISMNLTTKISRPLRFILSVQMFCDILKIAFKQKIKHSYQRKIKTWQN